MIDHREASACDLIHTHQDLHIIQKVLLGWYVQHGCLHEDCNLGQDFISGFNNKSDKRSHMTVEERKRYKMILFLSSSSSSGTASSLF